METFWNEYEIEMYNRIKTVSKQGDITDLGKLKEQLAKQNISMKVEVSTSGKVKRISFETKEKKLEIDGNEGKTQFLWDKIKKNVENNLKVEREKEKEIQNKPTYNRFEEVKRNREEQSKVINQERHSLKGLSR